MSRITCTLEEKVYNKVKEIIEEYIDDIIDCYVENGICKEDVIENASESVSDYIDLDDYIPNAVDAVFQNEI